MNLNLLELLLKEESGDDWFRILDLEKTKIPPVIATIKAHFLNSNEFELFEFLDNCVFYNARVNKLVGIYNKTRFIYIDDSKKNKEGQIELPPGINPNLIEWIWFRTAAVRVTERGLIEFSYDEQFINNLAKQPGALAFLIAHEASHILRFHIDRTQAAHHDPHKSNSAQDMIINYDIEQTPQIGGWKPIVWEKALLPPSKFHKDFEKIGKKAYYYENMYNWMLVNAKKERGEKGEEGGESTPPMDYYKEGQIVKVNSGDHKGEYRKITNKKKDGTYETEEVDIAEEIKKARGA